MFWSEAWKKAGDRGEDECPICMCPMEPVLPKDERSDTNDNNEDHLTSSLLLPQPPAEIAGEFIPEKEPFLATGARTPLADQDEAKATSPLTYGTPVLIEEAAVLGEGEEGGIVSRGDRGFPVTESGQRRYNYTEAGGNHGGTSMILSSTPFSSGGVIVKPGRRERVEWRRRRRRPMGDCAGGSKGRDGSGQKRETLLLSCSHVFHETVRFCRWASVSAVTQ